MIFVTVGTENYPFNRLVRSIDEGIDSGAITEKVFGQIGTATYLPNHYSYKRFLSYDEMLKITKESTIVVAHAGIGSIITCLHVNKIPILFPRRSDFNEHVDNHQMEFMRGMIKRKKLLWAMDEKELMDCIMNYKEIIRRIHPNSLMSGEGGLINHLQKIVS